jgi:hypothetical protein
LRHRRRCLARSRAAFRDGGRYSAWTGDLDIAMYRRREPTRGSQDGSAARGARHRARARACARVQSGKTWIIEEHGQTAVARGRVAAERGR